MSSERIIKALETLGLTRIESEVYVYTAKNGPLTIRELNEALNYSQKQINGSLATLIEEALITRKDAYFCAIPFEEALELLIERKKQQTESVQENIEKLLVNWKKEE